MTIQQFIRKHKELRLIAFGGFVSFLFIILIKGVVRPLHFDHSKIGIMLFGVLPNFFAASGFSAYSFLFIIYFLFRKKSDAVIRKALILSLIFPFSVICFWEYLQLLIWQYPVDLTDLFASVLGSGIIVIFIFFLTRELRNDEHVITQFICGQDILQSSKHPFE